MEQRPAFKVIWDLAYHAIENAEKIIAIGYALKEESIQLRFRQYREKPKIPVLLTLVNRSVNNREFVKLYEDIFEPNSVQLFHSLEEFCRTINH